MFVSSFLLFSASDFQPSSFRAYAKSSHKSLTISLKDWKVVVGCTWINSLELDNRCVLCLVSKLLNLKLQLATVLVRWPGIYSTGVSSIYRNRNQETLLWPVGKKTSFKVFILKIESLFRCLRQCALCSLCRHVHMHLGCFGVWFWVFNLSQIEQVCTQSTRLFFFPQQKRGRMA